MNIKNPKDEPQTLEGYESSQLRKLILLFALPFAFIGGLAGKYFGDPTKESAVIGGVAGMAVAGIIAAVRTRRHFSEKKPEENRGLYFSRTLSVSALSCCIVFGVLAGIAGELLGYDSSGAFRIGGIIGIVAGGLVAIDLTNRKYGKN